MALESLPIVLYDNQCYVCIKFARMINFLSKGKLRIIGHYSEKGEQIRKQILDKSALEMFWLIEEGIAFGGRTALIPLLKAIITSKNHKQYKFENNPNCEIECNNTKAVFLRSASLISKGKKIAYDDPITTT